MEYEKKKIPIARDRGIPDFRSKRVFREVTS